MVSFVVACSSGFHSHAILLGAFLLRASFYLHNNHSSTEIRTKMKISVLASLALLLALVGAYDADASEEINLTDDRRLAFQEGEKEVGDCQWKWPYSYDDRCYKVKWCPSTDGKWDKESVQEINWRYCWNKGGGGGGGGGSGSGSDKNLKKKCRRWARKYIQCVRQKPTSNVSFVGLVSSLGAHVLMCSAHI